MSAFQLSDTLVDINQGAQAVQVVQMYPMSGNVTNSVVGEGQASGLTSFLFQDTVNWWLPESSYFRLRLQFKKNNAAIPADSAVAYVDNFVHTLFTQVQTQINSQVLDLCNFPWIIDTALCYSQSRKTFLDTWGSLSRVGESLMTRINNISSNNSVVEVIFRPPVSLFSAKILPPGAQFLIQFNWAGNGLQALEPASNAAAVTWGVGATDYNITVQDFSFFKATISPSPAVSLPPHGVVDLSCSVINQTYSNASPAINYQWSPPGYINRLTICMQDTRATNNLANGSGIYSATKFNYAVSEGTTAYSTPILNMYVSIPELGCQMPNPTYNFSSGIVDWIRAYADFCESTQGCAFSVEGSVPFGSQVVTPTITKLTNAGVNKLILKSPLSTTAADNLSYSSSPDNKNAFYDQPLISTTVDASTVVPYAKNSAYGWAGSPIFVFPIVRPTGKPISTLNLNVQMAAGTNPYAVFWLISTYNMALACEHAGNGQYKYSIINGV